MKPIVEFLAMAWLLAAFLAAFTAPFVVLLMVAFYLMGL